MNNFLAPRTDAARFWVNSTSFYAVPAGARVALIYEGSAAFPESTLYNEIAISRGPDSLESLPLDEVAVPRAIRVIPGTAELNRALVGPGESPAAISRTWKRLPRLRNPPRDALNFRGVPGLLRLRWTWEYRTNGLDVLGAVCASLGISSTRWTPEILRGLLSRRASAGTDLILSGTDFRVSETLPLPIGMYLGSQATSALQKALGANELTPGVMQYVALVLAGGYNGMYPSVGDGDGWFADSEIPEERSLVLPFMGETLVGPPQRPIRDNTLIGVGLI